MAKGKSASGKHYTSKGERSNVKKFIVREVANDRKKVKLLDIVKSWKKGQNPWITIPNPNKEEKDKPFLRIKTNEHFGSPWASYTMKERNV